MTLFSGRETRKRGKTISLSLVNLESAVLLYLFYRLGFKQMKVDAPSAGVACIDRLGFERNMFLSKTVKAQPQDISFEPNVPGRRGLVTLCIRV